MTFVEILKIDHDKNHPDSSTWLISLEEILSRLAQDWSLTKFNNTAILYRPTGVIGDGMEFHCYNAGTGQELADNVLAFLADLRDQGYVWASTPYQNPRVQQLFDAHIEPAKLITHRVGGDFVTTVTL